MSYLEWHVGMKVVCMEDAQWQCADVRLFPRLPEKGHVYTISLIAPDWKGVLGVQLKEIDNPTIGKKQGLFEACYFRPVQSRKTDISVFTAMLSGAKQEERA